MWISFRIDAPKAAILLLPLSVKRRRAKTFQGVWKGANYTKDAAFAAVCDKEIANEDISFG
ncbi:hypothetical protein KG088_19405 [Halomonas sp. TRM85114]|uniref:hypothetical protein n=1 Tax=Halomonas jincaotanensis TaxID=2810616 RepID=UPI001BD1F834|nr:hypothetical protein [Halomonas jincaotanensis]MBS9405738.1 hypothetical protein [Halomonas jincaotanensis]